MNRKNNSILFLVIILAILLCTDSYPTFDEYVHDFQKQYSSQEERIRRKDIYENRVATFVSITEYIPGVNNFTDWTQEEISSLKSYRPPRNDLMSNSQSDTSIIQDNNHLSVGAQTSLDWRGSKVVTSVKTQSTCGACWAFSVAGYLQSKLIIQKGYGIGVDLSEQYLVSCTNGSDCGGGYAQDAMQLVANKGIPYESSYPYDPFGVVNSKICTSDNRVTQAGTKARWIRNVTDSKIIDLLQQGPLVISISADNWEFYNGGIFTCPVNSTVNHGVLLVGYTPDYWIAKNQWGKTWGQSGYIRVTRSRNNSYTNCYIGNLVTYMDPVKVQSTNFSLWITSLKWVMVIFLVIMVQ